MSDTEVNPASNPLGSDHPLPDCMYGMHYLGIQRYLDEALGTAEDDGAGAGIEGDVWLLGQQRDEARAALEAVRGQARRYLEARYGKAVWYRAPETFENVLERWIWALSSGYEAGHDYPDTGCGECRFGVPAVYHDEDTCTLFNQPATAGGGS